MSHLQLLLLICVTLAGAWLSARVEAKEYSLQRHLSHLLLFLIRAGVALLAMGLIAPPENHWRGAMTLTMMAGFFGPGHRSILNLTRKYRYPSTNKGMTWHRLGKSLYDSFWVMLLRGNEKAAFVTVSLFETLVAVAMAIQLTP